MFNFKHLSRYHYNIYKRRKNCMQILNHFILISKGKARLRFQNIFWKLTNFHSVRRSSVKGIENLILKVVEILPTLTEISFSAHLKMLLYWHLEFTQKQLPIAAFRYYEYEWLYKWLWVTTSDYERLWVTTSDWGMNGCRQLTKVTSVSEWG